MSGDTQVGSIVAYLVLRREDWSAGVRDTERDAERLGRLSPTIRIQTNTGEVLGQLALVHAAERKVGTSAAEAKPFVMNLWAALAAVAPAAVPIAAVAGGAMLGLIPVAATVALGIAGIKNQMKAGALQGTEFATQVDALKAEFKQLQQTAASGLMGGLDQAMQQSQPLFAALNGVIGQTSTELGNIVAGAGPALVSILVQLGPLFATIGTEVAKGAQALEHWTQSSNGISNFVAYIQAELPDVEHLLGGVIELLGHLLQGSAGSGSALLHDLNLLVDALDSIPVGVLQTAIPLAISFYAALKAGQGISAIVNGINRAITSTKDTLLIAGPKAEAAAAMQTAAFQQTSAAAAAEAATVAEAKALEARATADAALQIAASVEGTSSVLEQGSLDAALAADQFAAAMESEAVAAQAAADEIAAAAQAAADASVASGEAAAAGWTSMLGPIGAVAVGAGLLATLFMHSGESAAQAAANVNTLTEALKADNGVVGENTRLTTLHILQQQGAVDAARRLHISVNDLVDASLGQAAAQGRVNAALKVGADIVQKIYKESDIGIADSSDTQKAINKVTGAIGDNNKELHKSQQNYQDQVAVQREAAATTSTISDATRRQAAALHMTGDAYLAAQQSAQKNTDQTKAQTQAMQAESDAAGLLNLAFQTLAGQNLNVAQAQTAFGQSVHSVIDAMHQNGTAIKGNSVAALANQQAIEGSVSAARQVATAIAQQTKSNDKANASYEQSKKALEGQLRAHGELTPAVQRYIDKLYAVKDITSWLGKNPGQLDMNVDAALSHVNSVHDAINNIPRWITLNVGVNNSVGKAVHDAVNNIPGHADGGTVYGPGGPKSDSILVRLSAGEEVTPEPQASKHRALLKAIAADQVTGYASGGTVGHKAKGPTSTQVSNVDSSSAALLAVAADMAASAASVRSAASALDKSARAAGLSQAALASTAADQHRLSRDAAARERLAARLGTAPSAPTAYDRLAAAQSAYSSDRDKYRSALLGFDITGTPPAGPTTSSSSVGGATVTTTTPGSGQVTAASILAAGGADVAQVQEFDHLIHKLVAEGLDPDYVAQIAGKGPQALDTARALAKATPAQVRGLNSQEKQRKSTANDLGTFLAKQYDQAGINAAKGLINGLKSQEKQLTAEMEHIADHMVNTFKHKLGIHSPSVVFDGLGGHSVQGLINGAQRKLHLIRSTSQDMADALMSRFPAAGASGPAGGQGAGVQVVVQPRADHSEQRIGRAVADEVMWQLRR